jgi:hypothetical protein
VQRIVYIRKWKRGEEAKTVGIVAHHAGSVLVGQARQVAGKAMVSKKDAWRREREESNGNLLLVHHGERPLWTPVGEILSSSPGHANPGKSRHILWRHKVMVNVDAKCLLSSHRLFLSHSTTIRAIASKFTNDDDKSFHNDEAFQSSTCRRSLQASPKFRCDCPGTSMVIT